MSNPKFGLGDRPRRHPDSAFRAVGEDGGLVVLAGKAEVKVLNPVGMTVFALLDGQHELHQIVGIVADEFDVDTPRALADVQEFLADLDEHGMLLDAAAAAQQETSG